MPGGDRTQEADRASRPLSAGRDAAGSPRAQDRSKAFAAHQPANAGRSPGRAAGEPELQIELACVDRGARLLFFRHDDDAISLVQPLEELGGQW